MTSPLDLGELERLARAVRDGNPSEDAYYSDLECYGIAFSPSTALALIEEVKRLREVVKPFIARHWTDEAPDDPAPHELTDDDVIDITVPFGALRKARAALQAAHALEQSREHGPETEAFIERDGHFIKADWIKRGASYSARIYEPQMMRLSPALADLIVLAFEAGRATRAALPAHPAGGSE